MLLAGLGATALSALGGRRAGATTPPTEPPLRPSDDDIALLARTQQLELTARDLYQTAIDAGAAGDEDRVLQTARDNHQAAGDALSAMIGTAAPQKPDDALVEEFGDRFATSDLKEAAAAGFELENTLVATNAQLVGTLQGLDGATTMAAVLVMQSRMCTVMADLSGQGDDPAALFENSASPLTTSASEG
jgi:hypothetical protein